MAFVSVMKLSVSGRPLWAAFCYPHGRAGPSHDIEFHVEPTSTVLRARGWRLAKTVWNHPDWSNLPLCPEHARLERRRIDMMWREIQEDRRRRAQVNA